MTDETKAPAAPAQAPVPDKDPIVDGHLNWHIAVASALLLLSTVWAIYNEAIGLRPWKEVQEEFKHEYKEYLETLKGKQEEREAAVLASEGYVALNEQLDAATAESAEENKKIGETIKNEINPRVNELNAMLKPIKAEIGERIYGIEIAHSEKERERLREELEAFKAEHDLAKLDGELNELKNRKSELSRRQAEILRPVTAFRAERDNYLKNHLDGLTVEQVDGLLTKVENFRGGIQQIHVKKLQTRFYNSGDSVDLVDRCKTCHLGITEPVTMTSDDIDPMFITHPNPELLKIHDPEMFGCSLCHGGNGVATTSVEKAHGHYKHWLWPMYDKENAEAGCIQCHDEQIYLPHADVLNQGKDLFSHRGCWGCHPRAGFDKERQGLQDVGKDLASLDQQTAEYDKLERAANAVFDDLNATDEQIANANRMKGELLPLWRSALETREATVLDRQRNLIQARKKAGPNLKDIRAKLVKEWIPGWIEDPAAFRPDTRMPTFRLEDEQVRAISAFLWQSAIDVKVPTHKQGDVARGETIFKSRGCLACHTIELDGAPVGDGFATDLSRVGEKMNYDYMVRWIYNPRERLQPYSPALNRDLTEADYAEKGLPFEFNAENHACPISGEELVYEQMTVMPSLRLTWEECEDVASYLMTRVSKDRPTLAEAPYMEDTALFERGKTLVKHFGCAGCHEIAGLENERGIGTDLTFEGSKPIERLDFAHLTHDAKEFKWYSHKGFFEQKLRKPEVFDYEKERTEFEKLRMPNFRLKDEEGNDEVRALVTFLLGSVESRIPSGYQYAPEAGRERDQIDGWWVLKKYNCVGCHQFEPGVRPAVQQLPWFAGDKVVDAPPNLVGQGFRSDPNWLSSFLKDPSLGAADPHRNGVRAYLQIRMPSFHLAENEIEALVKFFNAESAQTLPYQRPKQEPLAGEELDTARDAFKFADCILCHATSDDPKDFKPSWIAPSFTLSEDRLKPEWVERWLKNPSLMMPGTKMPELFQREEGGRWILQSSEAAPLPARVQRYKGDHVELLMRYLQQFDAQESARYK